MSKPRFKYIGETPAGCVNIETLRLAMTNKRQLTAEEREHTLGCVRCRLYFETGRAILEKTDAVSPDPDPGGRG